MDHSSVDEAIELLTRAERGVLLCVPVEPSADAFAAAVAVRLALGSLQKPATVVSPSHVPAALQFLPGTAQVQESIPYGPELVLEIPVGDQRPEKVDWEVADGTLRIAVHPERAGSFAEATVNVRHRTYPWDRIVMVGVPRPHALGDLFTAHARFFYDTPTLNIDRGTANEFFGTVNLVPATAGTISEVVADLLETLGGSSLLTPDVATCLLAGIVAGTDAFRTPWTTPRTFQVASQLMAQEADHGTIIRRLFRTHALPELRLLGRALSRMEEIRPSLLSSTLTSRDVEESGGSLDNVPAVFHELLQWVGERRSVILVLERRPGTLEALIALGKIGTDDRDAFREAVHGTAVGPWVLVNFGAATPADARRLTEERILPQLPGADQSPGP